MTSGKLLQSALEFIDKVDAASGLDEIRLLLLRSARQFGFHSLIVCDVPVAGGPLDVHLCECPPGFFERYMARGYYAHDPLARHASQTTEPFLWSEVQWDHSRGSAEQLVMDEAAGAGLEEGFVVPIVGLDKLEPRRAGRTASHVNLRPSCRAQGSSAGGHRTGLREPYHGPRARVPDADFARRNGTGHRRPTRIVAARG